LLLADGISRGASLEQYLQSDSLAFPPYLAGLLRAGIRSGRLSNVLSELSDHYRDRQDLWQIRMALFYPAVLIGLLTMIMALLLIWVIPEMGRMFADFGAEVPRSTKSLLWFSSEGWMYFCGALAAVVVGALLIRIFGGAKAWMRVVASTPGLGNLFQWSGLAEFAQLLRLLVGQGMPLPESLRLTADAVRNANVADSSQRLADRVQRGQRLADGMAQDPQIPGQLVSIVRVGEENGDLPTALQAGAELLEGHIQLRSQLLTLLLPPILFIIIAGCCLVLMVCLFLPVFSLIQSLAF
jgi:type II secretory pathway component PulF